MTEPASLEETAQPTAASEPAASDVEPAMTEGSALENEPSATPAATDTRTARRASAANDPRAGAATAIEATTCTPAAAANLAASSGAAESGAEGESLSEMAARKLERAPIAETTTSAPGDEFGSLSALDESIETQPDAPETSAPTTAKAVEQAAARAPEAAASATSAASEGADRAAVTPRAEGSRSNDPANAAARAPEANSSAHSALDADRAAEVLRQVRMRLTPELRQAVIQLEPRELGRISIRLSVARGVVRAEMRAESPAALEALERHTPELKAALERAGLATDNFSLELGFEGSGAEHDARGSSNPRSFSNAASNASSSPDALRAVARRITAAAGGVDTYA